MTTTKDKKRFLEALRTNHMVLHACRKTGISKSTYYRWRERDQKFAKAADLAMQEALEIVNDVAESSVIQGVKDQDPEYTKYWLNHRHPAYAEALRRATIAISQNTEGESILEIFAQLKPKTQEMLDQIKKPKSPNHE